MKKKGYWVSTFRSISDPAKVDAYRTLAGPILRGAGGKFLVRGNPSKTYEKGLMERVVVIEFESVEQAMAAHDSPDYQHALEVLGDGAVRDIRIVEAADEV